MSLLLAWVLLAGQSNTAATPEVHDLFTRRMNAGVAALTAKKYDRAALEFHAAAGLRKDDPQPPLLAGEALVYGGHPEQAIVPLERAVQLDHESSQAHQLLAAAYSGAGMNMARDAEIALLAGWHRDGKHPAMAQRDGFLLESFRAGLHTVNTYAYFDPSPANPVVWRFSVRNSSGAIERFYCLSGSGNGPYTLAWCGDPAGNPPSPAPSPDKTYASLPDYSQVRADLRGLLSVWMPVRASTSGTASQ